MAVPVWLLLAQDCAAAGGGSAAVAIRRSVLHSATQAGRCRTWLFLGASLAGAVAQQRHVSAVGAGSANLQLRTLSGSRRGFNQVALDTHAA